MTRSQRRHAEEKVEGQTHSVEVLSGVACRHLQTFHSGLKNYLQQEWDFPACHPAHKGVITPGGGGLGAILPHRSFQGRHLRCAIVRYHPPVSQAGGDGNSKPDFVRLGELERLTCHHNLVRYQFSTKSISLIPDKATLESCFNLEFNPQI